jgi:hypothetical protein
MDLDSAVDICKKPNPEPVALGKYMSILFFIFHPVTQYCLLECLSNDYQIIICIVLIVVIFLGLINHNME